MLFGLTTPAPLVQLFILHLVMLFIPFPASAQPPSQQLHPGGAINLFSRYGYLSISIRVVPRNDTEPWVFREPTVDVFRDTPPFPPKKALPKEKSLVFDGDFHMEFCDDVRQLMQAYFRDFTVERLPEPWRAYAGSWGRAAIARHLGINATYVGGQYCYVLVRVARRRTTAKLEISGLGETPKDGVTEEPVLTPAVQKEADSVVVGNPLTVDRFIRSFGSHYISSYVTGNSLFQVFVYVPHIYTRIKERLRTRGVAELTRSELASFFSPWYVEHTGKIQVASGNDTVSSWAQEKLRVTFFYFSFASLLRLHGDARLLRRLDAMLGDEAVLQLELKSLAPAFHNPVTRKWFEEVLDNRLRLWEANM